MSIPSGEPRKNPSGEASPCPDGFFKAATIRERLATSAVESAAGGSSGDLDTRKLMEKLEALAIPQELLDDRTPPPEVSPATTPRNDPASKDKGFFNELSSWALPDEAEESSGSDVEEVKEYNVSNEFVRKVEAGVKSFFNKTLEIGSNWIESSASELDSLFQVETQEAHSTAPASTPSVPTPPIEDFYTFNDYKIRTKGFGALMLRKMKLDKEISDSCILFTFKIVSKSDCELKTSVEEKSLILSYGTDVAEITVPATKDPKLLKVRDVIDDLLIVETY